MPVTRLPLLTGTSSTRIDVGSPQNFRTSSIVMPVLTILLPHLKVSRAAAGPDVSNKTVATQSIDSVVLIVVSHSLHQFRDIAAKVLMTQFFEAIARPVIVMTTVSSVQVGRDRREGIE